VAGAYGTVLIAQETLTHKKDRRWFDDACEKLANARPTAVNLRWGVAETKKVLDENAPLTGASVEKLLLRARQIHEADRKANAAMAELGAPLLKGSVMTVCNTGDLCTGGGGTAFGVIREAHRQGRVKQVYALETRPLLQGLRLTAWELEEANIPYTLICDNMAASVMKERGIDAVILGADRIASNGDFANKIGSYMLAVLAHFHKIPFYVAAPTNSFDLTIADGKGIEVEERAAAEVLNILGTNRPKRPFSVYNPAFDVTPKELVTAIICEKGVIQHPSRDKILAESTRWNEA
jgi:methylthioribose-1-phosphate isomerase